MSKYQDLERFEVPCGFRGRSAVFVQLWWISQSILIGLSPQPLYRWRAFILRIFGAKLGKNVKIRPSARITYPWKVSLGDNVWIGDRTELYSLVDITIGDNSCISQGCYICTGSHDHTRVDFPYKCAPIHVSSEVWIAAGTFVLPGSKIGRGTVIGARSMVRGQIPGGRVMSGSPLQDLGKRELR